MATYQFIFGFFILQDFFSFFSLNIGSGRKFDPKVRATVDCSDKLSYKKVVDFEFSSV